MSAHLWVFSFDNNNQQSLLVAAVALKTVAAAVVKTAAAVLIGAAVLVCCECKNCHTAASERVPFSKNSERHAPNCVPRPRNIQVGRGA